MSLIQDSEGDFLQNVLRINSLHTYFYTYEGTVKALYGVNLELNKKDIFGVVGETGCGKTTTALSIMRLISPPGKIVKGEIIFNGEDLLKKDEAEMRKIRGKEITMIFQEPMTSLNPVFNIGRQIKDIIKLHLKANESEASKETYEILKVVGMPDPKVVMGQYPHELSGGMRQRAMIAMALVCKPSLLIADEPTSLLDVTIEAQILALIKDLLKDFDLSLLLITHDLGIIAEMCNKVAIMYAGGIVEKGNVRTIFKNPKHPYTQGLINAIPSPTEKKDRLVTIPGTVPSLIDPPPGCRFHTRCTHAMEMCSKQNPVPMEIKPGHWVSCFLQSNGGDRL